MQQQIKAINLDNDQDVLDTWKSPSQIGGAALFLVAGCYLLTCGVAFAVINENIVEFIYEYGADPNCATLNQTCKIIFEIPTTIPKPVYFYYELHSFNQNHKIYLDSIDEDQLTAKVNYYDNSYEDDTQTRERCYPRVTNDQMKKYFNVFGDKLNPNDIAIPCGLRASTYFNASSNNSILSQIPINENSISWSFDKSRYKNVDLTKQWIDYEKDEHFQVWIRPAGLSKFKKLWGRINDHDLVQGKYILQIDNRFNISYYGAKKYFAFTNLTELGGNNPVLIISHIATGVIAILTGLYMFIIVVLKKKR